MPFYYNEASMTPSQIHFLRALLDGKREISEQEAEIRIAQLELRELTLPKPAELRPGQPAMRLPLWYVRLS